MIEPISRRDFIWFASIAIMATIAGCTGINRIVASTEASPTMKISPTFQMESSPTFTPEPTYTPTIEPTKAIPENPGSFEGVGEIASVEEHDGKWYGIDTMGRAEIVQENGVWTLFERPVGISDMGLLEHPIPEAFLEEVNQSEITRLNDGGTELPWGLIRKVKPFDGYTYTDNYLSGYALGAYSGSIGDLPRTVLVYEVPLRYGRQILTFLVEDNNNAVFGPIFFIPESGNIQELDQNPLVWHELSKILLNPSLRGRQMVVATPTNKCRMPYTATNCDTVFSEFDRQNKQLLTKMGNGQVTSNTGVTQIDEIWLDESYNPFK